ncbi:MAG: flagellar hook-basal body complex protein FliE [Rhodospirillaceae bacterium]|nr:flagellar hook-basal body complex protein FliE [Rhodospirillaceae bacterium]
MAVDFSVAARALNDAASLSKGQGLGSRETGTPGVEFSQLLKDTAEQAIDSGVKAEDLTSKAVQGDAELTDVVTAVANAEITLQTVVAVRDKFIAAYQEILRMPI